MKDKMLLSCLKLKHNSFKPLKQQNVLIHNKYVLNVLESLKNAFRKNSKAKEETVSIENRSSHQRCSMKKDVLKNFTKFTGRPATLLKKRLWHRCFPKNFANFLRTPFLQNTSGRLLLREDIVLIIL